MFDDLAEEHTEIVEDCEYEMGDKGYDSVEAIRKSWEEYGIKTVIKMWKDGEATRTLKSRNIENVTYDYKGTVFCHCSVTGESYRMSYCGFEKDRNILKYTCHANIMECTVR